jgi:polyisoprenoid-binding protein YceI
MRSKAQLWADKHGTITFRSTGCAEAGDGAVRVTGDLTVRGQAARKTVTLALDAGAADLTATGRFTANATDFGFSPYSAMAGALKNRDQMRFTVKLRGSVR